MEILLLVGLVLIVLTFFKFIKRTLKFLFTGVALLVLYIYFFGDGSIFDLAVGRILQMIGDILI